MCFILWYNTRLFLSIKTHIHFFVNVKTKSIHEGCNSIVHPCHICNILIIWQLWRNTTRTLIIVSIAWYIVLCHLHSYKGDRNGIIPLIITNFYTKHKSCSIFIFVKPKISFTLSPIHTIDYNFEIFINSKILPIKFNSIFVGVIYQIYIIVLNNFMFNSYRYK